MAPSTPFVFGSGSFNLSPGVGASSKLVPDRLAINDVGLILKQRTKTSTLGPGTVNTRDREVSLPVYLIDRLYVLSASHLLFFVSMNKNQTLYCELVFSSDVYAGGEGGMCLLDTSCGGAAEKKNASIVLVS